MFFFPFIVLFLVQSAWGYLEDSYYPVDSTDSYLYSDENPDIENTMSVQRRNNNNNFLRFGRSETKYDTEYDDYVEDFARPTRSGKIDKSDHYIRFGRSKQDFLRFGRDQQRTHRDRDIHLRFGRSISEQDQKKRNKRDTSPYQEEFKRTGSNFLRFGRNSNFMRFGRNPGHIIALPTTETENTHAQLTDLLEKIKQIRDSPLIRLLTDLAINVKQENKKCNS